VEGWVLEDDADLFCGTCVPLARGRDPAAGPVDLLAGPVLDPPGDGCPLLAADALVKFVGPVDLLETPCGPVLDPPVDGCPLLAADALVGFEEVGSAFLSCGVFGWLTFF